MNKLLISGCLLACASAPQAAPLKARSLEMGYEHVCAILTTGEVKCWGNNDRGQLGLGDRENRGDHANEMGNHLPEVDLSMGQVDQLALGLQHTCALSGSVSLKCWGDNTYGQLGLLDDETRGNDEDEMGWRLPYIDVSADMVTYGISSIAAGAYHTCALLGNGSVTCWGRNDDGQLGLGHQESYGDDADESLHDIRVDLGDGRKAYQITAGLAHTCALLDNATIKCWGNNDAGQLGIGSTFERGDNAMEMGRWLQEIEFGQYDGLPISVEAGATHNCARMDDGDLKCWGSNGHGQLGRGHTWTIGDEVIDMGNLFASTAVNPAAAPTNTVSAGAFHTCATGGGNLTCWGYNAFGQLGTENASWLGNDPGETGAAIPLVDLGIYIPFQVAAGMHATCARLLGGRIKCWGTNNGGVLGSGIGGSVGDNVGEMGANLPFVDLGDDGVRGTPPWQPTFP